MNYKRLASRNKQILKKYGTSAVLRIPVGESIYNNETASYTDAYKEHNGVCVVTEYQQRDIDGTLIGASDKRLLCTFPAEPIPGVSLIDIYHKGGVGNATYNVITCRLVSPDATEVLVFEIQGRK
jgi:hypothetical protein